MSFAAEPFALIEVAIVEIAPTTSVSFVVPPLAYVFITAQVLSVFCDEAAVPLAHADPQQVFFGRRRRCGAALRAMIQSQRCTVPLVIQAGVTLASVNLGCRQAGQSRDLTATLLDQVTLVNVTVRVFDHDFPRIVALCLVVRMAQKSFQ